MEPGNVFIRSEFIYNVSNFFKLPMFSGRASSSLHLRDNFLSEGRSHNESGRFVMVLEFILNSSSEFSPPSQSGIGLREAFIDNSFN